MRTPLVSSAEAGATTDQEVEHRGAAVAPSLRTDFLWTLFGNGVYAVSLWAVVVMLAKWSSPEVVGTYSFAIAVATPLLTFAAFQLRVVQVTDIHGEHRFSDYLGFRLVSMVGAMLVLTVICIGMRYSLSTTALVEASGLGLAVEAVSDVYYGRMQSHNRMDSIAKSMMMRGVLSITSLVGVVALTKSLLYGMLAMVVARSTVLLAFDAQVSRTLDPMRVRATDQDKWPRWKASTLGLLLKTTIPIGLVSVLVSLNSSIPRYFLEWSSGPRELGIFAALSFFQSSGNMVVGAMGQAAFNRLATSYARPDQRGFFPLLLKLVAIGLGMGALGFLLVTVAGKQILTLVFRQEYAARADVLQYLMISAGLGYCCQFVGSAVTAARIFRPQVVLFLVVVPTLIGLCYFLVPGHGAVGAITAIIGATVVQMVGFGLLLALSWRGRGSKQISISELDEVAVTETSVVSTACRPSTI